GASRCACSSDGRWPHQAFLILSFSLPPSLRPLRCSSLSTHKLHRGWNVMDEAPGILIVIGLIIAAIVFVVIAIFTALGWTFLAFSSLLGHPVVFVLLLAAL